MNIQSRLAALSLRAMLAAGIGICALILIALTLFALQHYNQSLPSISRVVLSEVSEERLGEVTTGMRRYATIAQTIATDSLNQFNFASFSVNGGPDIRRVIQNAFRQIRTI